MAHITDAVVDGLGDGLAGDPSTEKKDVATVSVRPRLHLRGKEGNSRLAAVYICNRLGVPVEPGDNKPIELIFPVNKAALIDLYNWTRDADDRAKLPSGGTSNVFFRYECAFKIERLVCPLPDKFSFNDQEEPGVIWIREWNYVEFRHNVLRLANHFGLQISEEELPQAPEPQLTLWQQFCVWVFSNPKRACLAAAALAVVGGVAGAHVTNWWKH